MRESDPKTALVPVQSTTLTKVGAMSLVARGRADLRVKEEAEQWLNRGAELYAKGSYEKAFACFERGLQLDPNNTEAQHILGFMYTHGEGVPQDYAQAALWYRRAAEQGDASAQYVLGSLYTHGEGVPQDCAQAAVWFRKAADQGNRYAQYSLGVRYRDGQGVPQDDAQAAIWYRKAAENGYEPAKAALAALRTVKVPEP
jgi:TPR repeat protein